MDKWLIDKLDTWMLALQKRGYLLTEIQVQVAGFTFVTCTFNAWLGGSVFAPIFNGLVFGINLAATIRWGNNNRDYPVSKKIMDKLNAEALFQREAMGAFRCIVLGMWMAFLLTGLVDILVLGRYMNGAMDLISFTSLTLMYYLYPCTYIGPGHFASKQRGSGVENAAPSKYGS